MPYLIWATVVALFLGSAASAASLAHGRSLHDYSSSREDGCRWFTNSWHHKRAYVTFITRSPVKSEHLSYRGADFAREAFISICSLKSLQTQYPVLVFTANAAPHEIEKLKEAGVDAVCDVSWWTTPFEINNPDKGKCHAQTRVDGVLTYYRFLAWNQTKYDSIMMFDTDVFFTRNPDDGFTIEEDAELLAFPEDSGRSGLSNNWLKGWNIHITRIKPSARRFFNLLFRTRYGNYRPFINTEQDVVETEFAPQIVNWPDEFSTNHFHGHNLWHRREVIEQPHISACNERYKAGETPNPGSSARTGWWQRARAHALLRAGSPLVLQGGPTFKKAGL